MHTRVDVVEIAKCCWLRRGILARDCRVLSPGCISGGRSGTEDPTTRTLCLSASVCGLARRPCRRRGRTPISALVYRQDSGMCEGLPTGGGDVGVKAGMGALVYRQAAGLQEGLPAGLADVGADAGVGPHVRRQAAGLRFWVEGFGCRFEC